MMSTNFLIEGNIGAGKSTFVEHLRELDLTETINIIPEPVDVWTNYMGHNYLQHFYSDQPKWTFAFQQMVLNTAANVYRNTQLAQRKSNRPSINFFERSMYSPINIFAKQQYIEGVLCDAEMELIKKITNDTCKWIDYDIKGIIYIQTDPDITLDRMQKRMRKEDCTLPLSYLENLHVLHEEWLGGQNDAQRLPVLIFNNNTRTTVENFSKVKEQISAWVANPKDMIINPESL